MMAKRRKGRPGAVNKKSKNAGAQDAEEHQHIKSQITDTQDLKQNILGQVYRALPILCCSVYIYLPTLTSTQGLDLQSMLSLQWDAAQEQWASRVSPKLASPHLSMAFFVFQDAAFVCALAWSVFIIRLFLPSMG